MEIATQPETLAQGHPQPKEHRTVQTYPQGTNSQKHFLPISVGKSAWPQPGYAGLEPILRIRQCHTGCQQTHLLGKRPSVPLAQETSQERGALGHPTLSPERKERRVQPLELGRAR